MSRQVIDHLPYMLNSRTTTSTNNLHTRFYPRPTRARKIRLGNLDLGLIRIMIKDHGCLLYTSDAADE